MSTARPSGHERQIDDVLRQVNRYWRGGGVPRPERRDRLEELRGHLQEASTAGRRADEVVGTDVAAFAADWMAADRTRPWLTTALRATATLALATGFLALLGPITLDQDPFTLSGPPLVVLIVAVLAMIAVDIIRHHRGQLSTRAVTLLGIAGVVAAGLVGGLATSFLENQVVAELPWPMGIALIAVGAVCAEVARRMRRTARTTTT